MSTNRRSFGDEFKARVVRRHLLEKPPPLPQNVWTTLDGSFTFPARNPILDANRWDIANRNCARFMSES